MKGNLLVSYLFKSTDEIKNMDIKQDMITDLQHLAAKWKAQGYIRRYIIADDDCISDKYKNRGLK